MRPYLAIVLILSGCAPAAEEPSEELIAPPPEDGKADGPSRASWVRSQIQAWNAELSDEERDEKYEKMAESPYAFFRGTNHLYWSQLARDARLTRYGGTSRTRIFLQGDLHPDNFGAFHDDDGRIVYDLNDFDESVLADYQLDVWHLAIGIALVAEQNDLSENDAQAAVEAFAESYLDALDDLRGNSDETGVHFDAGSTYGPLDNFLEDVEENESRVEMLDDWTRYVSGERTLNLYLEDLASADRSVANEIRAGLSAYGTTLSGGLDWSTSYFRVKGIARRLHAGVGSLGSPRYYVLIEGPSGSESDDVILDIKRQDLPTGYNFLSTTARSFQRAVFGSPGERVATAQNALENDADDHIGFLELSDGSYSVRERSPYKETFPVDELTTRDALVPMAEQWGIILANAHARSDRDFDDAYVSGSFEDQVHAATDGKHSSFRSLVWTLAEQGAQRVLTDYQSFLPLAR